MCCKRRLKAVVCQFKNRYREFESIPSATESLSLAIPRSNHRKARHSGVICKYVVAERITLRQAMGNSRAESLLANWERPFGPGAEWN
jgi:hypothetical protein